MPQETNPVDCSQENWNHCQSGTKAISIFLLDGAECPSIAKISIKDGDWERGSQRAAMITAAPKMLRALEAANRALNEHFQITDGDEAGNAVHDEIRAAIAEARE